MNRPSEKARIGFFSGVTAAKRAAASALLFATLLGTACCDGQEKPGGPSAPDPAAEADALKDLQGMLERIAADPSEQPHDRVETLRALARVREALDSWAGSIAYYDKLLADRPAAALCAAALSGALRACAARDGHLAGARVYLGKDAAERAQKTDEMMQHVTRFKNQLERISQFLGASAEKRGPAIRAMPEVRAVKNAEPVFWRVSQPVWMLSPPRKPESKEPNAPVPLTSLKLPVPLAVVPVLPDMLKRIALIPEPAAKP